MSLHVYAIAPHPVTVPDDLPLEALRLGEVDVAVGAAHDGPVTQADVLEHARIVDALFTANDALLPARYGHAFADAGAVEARLATRIDDLLVALDRVRGNVELGLRVTAPARHEPPDATSGRAYLEARAGQMRAAERAAHEIHDPLARAAASTTLNVLSTPQLLLSAAYLVARAGVDAFLELVDAATRRHPELSFVCTGPWPPYSFAMLDPTT